jgi:hypothetical protein
LRWLKRLTRKLHIINNSRKLKFEVGIIDKIPRIKIQEKHQKKVKNIVRIITIIGILSSLISFNKWYYSLGTSIVIFLIGQVFEKIIFTYTVMFVQPMPKQWDESKWSMMVVGCYNDRYVLGFGFNDKKVANDFFQTLLSWNNNKMINDNNIQISLILEDKNNYSVYAYPNIERDFVIDGIKNAEKEFKYDKYGKEQVSLVTQMNFCKVFPHSTKSAYSILSENTNPVYINIYDTSRYNESDNTSYQSIKPFNDRKILLNNIKIKKRKELNPKIDTIEYYHIPKL